MPEDETPRPRPPLAVTGSARAPIIYFDDAPTFGHLNGTIQVTLDAMELYPDPPGVKKEVVVVAHLRMSVRAAQTLRAALDGALLMAQPVDTPHRN